MIRIAHLSTAHGRGELRVHLKECNSLAAHGYEVFYIVADGLGDARVGNVRVLDIGRASNRFQRMLLLPWRMLAVARTLNAALYHFHDPEILLIALFLMRNASKVVYDSHEDVPRVVYSREWVPSWARSSLSAVFEVFENFVARRISAVVGATPHITARFSRLNPNIVAINNFPLRSEIKKAPKHGNASRNICYIGGINRVRGIEEMVRALEYVDARLILAGPFENVETEQAMRALKGWARVDYRGTVSRADVQDILTDSQIGLILYHPELNHVHAQPNKMFEYMSAGLPVVASDFPLWKELIVGADAGLVANPFDPKDIARVVEELLDDHLSAARMGNNGRVGVLERYNWTKEEQKLLELYRSLLA
ncbi:MAG: glycosyltransferase family 4 protein [Alphaproteobacteria bacterium]|nr:glycosyltransferase family 4 protein [Alphaproteobacteria bacterium]